jgi:putative transposase
MLDEVTKQQIIVLFEEAVANGCRKHVACRDLGLSLRTLQRWSNREILADRRPDARRTASNQLMPEEEEQLVTLLNSPEYRDKTPWEIVPSLADKGIYIASESSIYRLIRRRRLASWRNRSRPKHHTRPLAHVATGPNQVWSWDITYLRSQIRGSFYYLYMIMDIYSRKIVGWRVHETQEEHLAAALIEEACCLEGISQDAVVVLHSDNGSAMKGSTVLATMQRLGVIASFSRPRVSDDNPYSESLFKTLKYVPYYPSKPFESTESATVWVDWFVHWYNHERFHGEIQYVTPASRHEGKDIAILARRKEVYEQARNRRPNRWSRTSRNWQHTKEVYLNPTNEQKQKRLTSKHQARTTA